MIFNPAFGTVKGPDGVVSLTPLEAKVLGLLAKRDMVDLEVMYGFLYEEKLEPRHINAVRLQVHYLRKKLEQVGLAGVIETLRSRGWTLTEKVEFEGGHE